MQTAMRRALLRRGRSGNAAFSKIESNVAGNLCRMCRKEESRHGDFHYTIKIVGRSKGKSVISASAYLNGDVMKNEETGSISYYTSKKEVVYTSLMMCENAPSEWQIVPEENIKRFQKSVRYKRSEDKEAAIKNLKSHFKNRGYGMRY